LWGARVKVNPDRVVVRTNKNTDGVRNGRGTACSVGAGSGGGKTEKLVCRTSETSRTLLDQEQACRAVLKILCRGRKGYKGGKAE